MSKYKKSYCKKLLDLMAIGKINTEVCAQWKISEKTFYEWIDQHTDFKEAYEVGLASCESDWIKRGMEYMEQGDMRKYKFFELLVKRKFPKWREKDPTVTNNTQINIGNMNFASKSDQALLEYIQNGLDELQGPKEELPVIDAELIELMAKEEEKK
jgi:hypothetical protein